MSQNEKNYGNENILRLEPSFDMFNRRTEFPYDTLDNPMRIDPLKE